MGQSLAAAEWRYDQRILEFVPPSSSLLRSSNHSADARPCSTRRTRSGKRTARRWNWHWTRSSRIAGMSCRRSMFCSLLPMGTRSRGGRPWVYLLAVNMSISWELPMVRAERAMVECESELVALHESLPKPIPHLRSTPAEGKSSSELAYATSSRERGKGRAAKLAQGACEATFKSSM